MWAHPTPLSLSLIMMMLTCVLGGGGLWDAAPNKKTKTKKGGEGEKEEEILFFYHCRIRNNSIGQLGPPIIILYTVKLCLGLNVLFHERLSSYQI